MKDFIGFLLFAFAFFMLGYYSRENKKKHRLWYVEKEKNKDDWRFWDETPHLYEAIYIVIRLRMNGYKSRIKRYKFYTEDSDE